MSHYALLGIVPAATPAEIRAAFRERAVELAPENGGDAERFARLQAAYELLSDGARRADYDAELGDVPDGDGSGESFAEKFRGGAFTQSPGDAGAATGAELTGDAFGGKGLMGQLEPSVAQAIVPMSNDKGTLMETSYKLTHTEGFDAYLRNQGKSAGQVLTGDEMVKRGLIPATGSVDTVLPPLEVEALAHARYGEPQQVLRVARVALPDRCAHGQVLVRVLAAPLNDEDFVRVRTPLEALNVLQPFCRKVRETGVDNGWEPAEPGGGGPDARAPFCGGADGVGVVMAASKHGDNVRGSDVLPNDWGSQPKDSQAMPGRKDFFGPLDWVIVLPSARGAPIGSWRRLLVCHEDRLLRVAPALMPLPALALHRVFCTAWRLLEDYGALRSGDTVIFNAADEPVGCVLLQLCGLLQLTPICVVSGTPAFGAVAARLKSVYGAAHVLRDGSGLAAVVAELGLTQPRLALDAMGGAAGERLFGAVRAGCPVVVHSLRSGELPRLSAAPPAPGAAPGTPGAGSVHGFVLGEWVEAHGLKAYDRMLAGVAELVNSGLLKLDGEYDLLPCGNADSSSAKSAELPGRFSSTVLPTEPKPVLTGDEMVRRGLIPAFDGGDGSTAEGAGAGMMSAAGIAAALETAVRGPIAHAATEAGVWLARRKVVLTFGAAEDAADEAVELGGAIMELAQTLVWDGTKAYRPGEVPQHEPEPEPEPEPAGTQEPAKEEASDEAGAEEDEDEGLEAAVSVAAVERAQRVEKMQSKQPEPEPEPEPQPEAAAVAGGRSDAWTALVKALANLDLREKYSEALLGKPETAESVMAAATGSGDRDVLRKELKAQGVSKLGHREKLVGALYVEPTAEGGTGANAPARLSKVNIS